MADISLLDASNQIQELIKKSDERFDKTVDSINELTECLYQSIDNDSKYKSIVSIEYLLVKLRLDTEFEHLKIKSVLSGQDCPAALRAIFLKRDQLLAQRTLKLNAIRDDISVLQKVVYSSKIQSLK